MSQFAAQPQAGSPVPQQTSALDDPLLAPAKRGTARSFRLLKQRLAGAPPSPRPAEPPGAERRRTHTVARADLPQLEIADPISYGSSPASAAAIAFDAEGLIGSPHAPPPVDVDLSASEALPVEHPLLSDLDRPSDIVLEAPPSDEPQHQSDQSDEDVAGATAETDAQDDAEVAVAPSPDSRNLKMLLEPELPAGDEFASVDVGKFSEPQQKTAERDEASFDLEPEHRLIEGTRPAEFRFWEPADIAAPAPEEVRHELDGPAQDEGSDVLEVARTEPEPAELAATTAIAAAALQPHSMDTSLDGLVAEEVDNEVPTGSEPPATPRSPAESRRRMVLLRQAGSEPSEELGEVARSLLEIMSLPANATQPQERALAADSLLHLVHRLPVKTLVAMAERVSFMDAPPPLILAELIHDPRIEVAGPLLEKCSAINDQDLLEVIADGLAQSNRMIARRRSLTAVLCDALIATEDTSAILTLVRNPGAMVSHEAFYRLNELAKLHPVLQAPLATRSDLPAPVAFELFWVLPGELRRYVISRFLTDSTVLNKILKLTLRMDADQQEASPDRFSSPEDIDRFLLLLHAGRKDEAEPLMASLLSLDARTARRILADADGEPLTVALKAMGATRARFEEAFSSTGETDESGLRPRRSAAELQSFFESLSFNKARVLLTYWDWAISRSGPYAALSAEAQV